jgi:transposase-like protein
MPKSAQSNESKKGLRPINAALCPHCGSNNTGRGGYVKARQASAWKCRECEEVFLLKSLVLFKPST